MKFKEYLKEERISSAVKRSLLAAIKHPKKNVIVVGNKEVTITPQGQGVSFIFDEDMYELAMTITDLVDEMDEYKIKPSKKDGKSILIVLPE